MSTWLEMRCSRMWSPDCTSAYNGGPKLLAGDAAIDVLAGLSKLHAEARSLGWARREDGWACSHCEAARKPLRAPGQRRGVDAL